MIVDNPMAGNLRTNVSERKCSHAHYPVTVATMAPICLCRQQESCLRVINDRKVLDIADNRMVQKPDSEDFSRLFQSFRDLVVFFTGCEVA